MNHMQYYSELIETLTNKSIGFVKVMNPNVNNMVSIQPLFRCCRN